MLHTPLINYHREAGAKLVDFAGWEMPVTYEGLVKEHHYTRTAASFFDVSHMGRVEFRGADAAALLERLNTRKVGNMKDGQCRYSHMCNESGGILDDVIVNKFSDEHFMVVCNASNREKLLAWWQTHADGRNVEIIDKTLETAMLAIQGPKAIELLEALLPFEISTIKRYHFIEGRAMGADYLIARTGYTGEDGVEVIIPAHLAPTALNMLIGQSRNKGCEIKPAGLGARDSLRTEAGMPLYGHELSEEWDPITAGQGWVVHLDKDFIGKDAIAKVKENGGAKALVGFEVHSKRTPRQGAPIIVDGEHVGEVTSGIKSPTLEKVIAMGFLPPARAEAGTAVEIPVGSTKLEATVVSLPFYKRS